MGGHKISVSPNPTTGSINLTFTDQTDSTSLLSKAGENLKASSSVNSTGKTIVSLFEFNTSLLVRKWTKNEISGKLYNFNIAGLKKGIYVLQVDRNNETATTKIVIE